MSKIFEALTAVMADCPVIGKDQKNQQQNFMYRGVDVVMNVLQPLFIKHKVFVVPEVLESTREERQTARGGNLIYTTLKIRYTFYADDGSFISAVVQGEGMDSADKSSNKAMSVAFKYACFQVFCIPTEEFYDPDADAPDPSTPDNKAAKKPSPKKPTKPADNTPPPTILEVKCPKCGKAILSAPDKSGVMRTPTEVLQMCGGMCIDCMKMQKNAVQNPSN